MKTITTRIPKEHLRTYEFYASYYGVNLNALLTSDVYGQAGALTDETFGSLVFMDSQHTEKDLVPLSLDFSPQVWALLSRVARILRRPSDELVQDLLSVGGFVLGDHVREAFEKGGMEKGFGLEEWATGAVKFAALARIDASPQREASHGGKTFSYDCWDTFDIARPAKYSKEGAMS